MAKKTMNPMTVIGGVALVLAVLLGLWLYKKPGKTGDSILKYSSKTGDVETISTSFKELLTQGKDYTCTFATADEDGASTNGIVYVAQEGERLNGEFVMTQADESQMTANVIRDGEYSYFWSSEQEKGIKTKITENDNDLFASNDENSDEEAPFDPDQDVEFECKTWSPDQAMFVPPSNVEFVDFSMQMEQMESMMENSNSNSMMMDDGDKCSVCDQVPAGAQKDQCLQALGC